MLMEICTKEPLWMGSIMELVGKLGMMEVFIMDLGNMVRNQALDLFKIQMDVNFKVNGKTTRKTDSEHYFTKMEINIQDSLKMT